MTDNNINDVSPLISNRLRDFHIVQRDEAILADDTYQDDIADLAERSLNRLQRRVKR